VEKNESHSQRAQTQSRAARKPQPLNLSERLAFSPKEFAAAVGRSPTFGYRAIYGGWVRTISDGVRMMIPRSEVDRFLARAAEYNPQIKGNTADDKGGEA
jgi:hypothetical protein